MKIVLTTFGSFGDLHPYIAIGLGLQARGHDVTLATSHVYKEKIEAAGLRFHNMRPDLLDFGDPEDVIRKAMDLKTGTEYFVKEIATPYLREGYADLTAAVKDTDLLVTQGAVYAGPLVAAKSGVNWCSTILQPLGFISAYDPTVFPPVDPIVALLPRLRKLGPGFHRVLKRLMSVKLASWSAPIRQFRAELGLPPTEGDPMLDGQHSPHLVLALFSPLLAAPQPDWPPHTVQTGFPFYDRLEADKGISDELTAFLQAGSPPIVFTLGSSAVMDAGNFYADSAQAAIAMGKRAILLIGRDTRNRPNIPLPDTILAAEYAPYSELFPYASAIVHQGGVGTTGHAMRAGKPMLIMPYSHDQPDHAARIARMGIGRTVSRDRYTVESATRELRALLDTPSYAQKAADVGRQVSAENGIEAACDAIEANFQKA